MTIADVTGNDTHFVPDNRGERNGRAKLKEADVIEIRLRASQETTASALALEFGISPTTVRLIIRHKLWKSLPPIVPIRTTNQGPKPLIDRLMARVRIEENGCWVWTGFRTSSGYGHLGRGRRGEGMILAHRACYEHHKGSIPEGLELDHLCKNPPCVNPDHLEAVTHRENIMRSDSRTAVISRSGACARGHEFNDANTRWNSKGHRTCRRCDATRSRLRYFQRKREGQA